MNRDFRYSVGFYFEDKERDSVLIWHHCSNKPVNFLTAKFDFVEAKYGSTCPNCGEPLLRWEAMHGPKAYTRINPYSLNNDAPLTLYPVENKRYVVLHFAYIDQVRIDVTDTVLSIGVFESYYNLWSKTTVFKKTTYYTRYSMNVKTGQTYQFSKELVGRKYKTGKGKCMKNISFLYHTENLDLPDDALYCLNEAIKNQMIITHGENVPLFESYNLELTMDNLIGYVRNPFICPALYNKIVNRSRRNSFDYNPILRELSVNNYCSNPIHQILSQSKIPCVKSLKRIAYKDPEGLPLLASISRSFQNVDVIRSLYFAFIHCYNQDDDVNNYQGNYIDFSARVFKTMIKHKGEQIIASKLLSFLMNDRNNNAFQTLSDMILCYDELQHCDFDFSKSYSIDELHLYLAALVSKRRTENRTIAYNFKELALETSDEAHILTLAKDTHELVDVGMKMNICVGSYGDDAVSKHCTILVLRRKEDNGPVGCLELHGNTLVQAKGKCNQLLQSNELCFVEKWVLSKEVKVGTKDLQHATIIKNKRKINNCV